MKNINFLTFNLMNIAGVKSQTKITSAIVWAFEDMVRMLCTQNTQLSVRMCPQVRRLGYQLHYVTSGA